MPLPTQNIQIPFSKGLMEGEDPKQLQPGYLKTASNVIWDKNGRISKRNGYTTLGTGVFGPASQNYSISSYQDIVDIKNNPSVIGITQDPVGPCVLHYDSTGDSFSMTNNFADPYIREQRIATPEFGAEHIDIARANGYICLVWLEQDVASAGGALKVIIYQENTMVEIFSYKDSTTTLIPKVIGTGTLFNIFYARDVGASDTISCLQIDTSAQPFTTSTTSIVTNATEDVWTAAYEVCLLTSTSNTIAVVWEDDTDNKVRVRFINATTLAAVSTTVILDITATPDAECFALADDGLNHLIVVIGIRTGGHGRTKNYILNTSTLAVTAGTDVDIGAGYYYNQLSAVSNGAGFWICTSFGDAGVSSVVDDPKLAMLAYSMTTAAAITTGSVFWMSRRCSQVSKIFKDGSRYFIYAVGIPDLQQTLFLFEIQPYVGTTTAGQIYDMAPVGIFTTRSGKWYLTPYFPRLRCSLANVINHPLGTGVYASVYGNAKPYLGYGGATDKQFISMGIVDFRYKAGYQVTNSPSNTTISCGIIGEVSGSIFCENNFLLYPAKPTVTAAGAAGNLSNGTYLYKIVYCSMNQFGELTRSAPSSAGSVVAAATNTATITFPNLPPTFKHPYIRPNMPLPYIELYRTVANGSIFYKVSTLLHTTSQQLPNPGSVNAFTQTITDGISDASLTSKEVLYDTGGEFPNMCIPSCTSMVLYKNRIVARAANGTYYFSKEKVEGEPYNFSDALTFTVDDESDDGGLAVLDSNLIIFRKQSIYVMSFDGPTANGTGSDLRVPQKISSDVGCTSIRSIVQTPDGIYFRYNNSIRLLNRSLSVINIGLSVEDELSDKTNTTSAVLVPFYSEIRWTIDDGSSSGIILVYNYKYGNWSTWTLSQPGEYVGTPIVGATVSDGTYYFVENFGGSSQKENPSSHLDVGGTKWITMDVETAPMQFAGMLGWQRAKRVGLLGLASTGHDIRFRIATDFESTYNQDKTFTSDIINAYPLESLQVHIKRQKSTAFSVRITDATPTSGSVGIGAGPIMSGLIFQVGKKEGSTRDSPQQSG